MERLVTILFAFTPIQYVYMALPFILVSLLYILLTIVWPDRYKLKDAILATSIIVPMFIFFFAYIGLEYFVNTNTPSLYSSLLYLLLPIHIINTELIQKPKGLSLMFILGVGLISLFAILLLTQMYNPYHLIAFGIAYISSILSLSYINRGDEK